MPDERHPLHGQSRSCDECGHPLSHHDSMGCVDCDCEVAEPVEGWTDEDYDRADGHA